VSGGVAARAGALAGTLALSLLVAASPAEGKGSSSPRQVRLALPSAAQAQFAGAYVAIDAGIYRQHDLEVQITSGGPGRDPVDELRAGRADLALLDLTAALRAIDSGVPLSHVGQIVPRSTLVLVAWKNNGIARLGDFAGRRVTVWEDNAACRALFADRHLEVVLVPQHDTLNLFLQGGVDACLVHEYRESHMLYQAGVDDDQLTRFPLADAGIDFPEDGLYALRPAREAMGASAAAFLAATLEGWRHAAAHRDEAVAAVMQRVDAEHGLTNRTLMRWMLDHILEIILPRAGDEQQAGVLPRDAYEKTASWMIRLQLIHGAPSYEELLR
jgi:NitT/TauT family transport system substrate-binding protein